VLSALGLVASEERRDLVVPYVRPLAEVTDLPTDGEADLRYAGQSFELTVPIQHGLAEAFNRAHEERYGYADRGESSSWSLSVPRRSRRGRSSTSQRANRSTSRAGDARARRRNVLR